MPRLELDSSYFTPLMNGIKIKNTFTNEQSFLLYAGGELFGIATTDELGIIKIQAYLRD